MHTPRGIKVDSHGFKVENRDARDGDNQYYSFLLSINFKLYVMMNLSTQGCCSDCETWRLLKIYL